MTVSPIVLFAYKRPTELKKVINALLTNTLISESELYIYVDGPKSSEDAAIVKEVQNICDEITGFKKVIRTYSKVNQGCANAIINGISSVLKVHESVIVIEDDIVTSSNFLEYMNQCLDYYRKETNVFSISGFSLPFKIPLGYTFDVFSFPRTCSWGWATWQDRWFSVDWEVADYQEFIRDKKAKNTFLFAGSDVIKMLKDYMQGKIDAWDIRFCYSQFKQKCVTIYPTISKAENIGFYGENATHTNVFNRYKTNLDITNKVDFNLINDLKPNESFTRQFQAKYSVYSRGLGRIKTLLGMR